ncbi:MAG: hypothetical protein IT577_24420 [Verrucomicrobiae bacterium]|nr:hypothetical protein [Verrucomicrobiae bacterium]
MTVRDDPTDPACMSPDDRLAEVAGILAEGVLRLRRRAAAAGESPATVEPSESSRNCLEPAAETRLDGPRG